MKNSENRAFWEISTKVCRASGKRVYRGQYLARLALHHLRDSGKSDGNPLHVYACIDCDGWHVGHVPGWRTARRYEAS